MIRPFGSSTPHVGDAVDSAYRGVDFGGTRLAGHPCYGEFPAVLPVGSAIWLVVVSQLNITSSYTDTPLGYLL